MTDDGHSVALRGAGRRRIRMPLRIVNQGSDSDEDDAHAPSKREWNPSHGLPSPSRSPYSEYSSLPSTSYTPRNLPHHHPTPSLEEAPLVPPLPSPSSSSSPNDESTPPPSTPGQSAAPGTSFNGSVNFEDGINAPDDALDPRQQAAGRPTYMDRGKQNIPPCLQPAKPSPPSRPATSPTYSSNQSHTSPTYLGNPSRDQALPKILLMLTTDCETYVQLDVTGARNGAYIKEKMFTKLQITDDQQPYFSIYKTDIGSYALTEALSDDRLLEMCRSEGDGKGTVKFLVQHSSATLHLQAPPSRYMAPSHIPPVLPDQESFRSPNNHRARSVRSNHDSKSSTSEHYYAEVIPANFEESASDDDPFDKDRQRNTIRPSPQQAAASYFNPSSPLDQRRVNGSSARDPSPPKLSLSPGRARNTDAMSPVVKSDRNRFASTPVHAQFSPNRPYDDGSFTPPPSRRVHNYSASDAASERERAMEQAERDRMPRKVDRIREAQGRRRAYDGSDGSGRRTEEPWVVVKNNGGSASNARTGLHTPSNSHPNEITGRFNYSTFSSSRSNLPLVPPPPRNAPPPIPSSTSSYSNRPGLAVPPNWPVKGIPGLGENPRLQPSKSARLQAAKSMDNLRGMNSPMPGSAQRKQSQNSMSRPSVAGLREAASSQGSFMNMEMSPPSSRRDPALPRSVQDRNFISSPTAYTSRPLAVNVAQSQSDNSTNGQTAFSNRPPPIQVQPSLNNSSTLLGVSGVQGPRKSPDDLFPRPHSALDDIGASPAPSRHVRPLPSTGNHGGSQSGSSSWIDVESLFEDSPRVTSPHPYASQSQQPHPQAARPSTAGSMAQSSSQQSVRQGTFTSNTLADSVSSDIPSSMTDSTVVQPPRSMRIAQNPDSPRRTPLDTRAEQKKDNDTPKSFVPLQDARSYEKEMDGNSTLKPEDHGYLVNMLGGSSGEGTLKQTLPRSQTDKTIVAVVNVPVPTPLAKTESAQSTFSNTTEGDEYDDEDFDDASSLWKVPSKPSVVEPPKRPNLVVDTDNEKSPSTPSCSTAPQTASRSPAVPVSLRPNQGPPPNFPPPNFPPPPPPPLRRHRPSNQRPRDGKSEINKRDSQFIKSSAEAWDFRPPAEGIYGNLDAFFPDHDLDKPVIEQSTSGGTSPTSAEPNIPAFQNTQTEREKRFNKKKSIRIVAAEHKKKIEDRISRAETPSSVMRKRSTKLWGSKVEEVTPFPIPSLPATVPESPTAPNPKPIFKWVRGELIGKGTYGRVYLALNATTGEMIAVKQVEIPKTDADRGDSRQAIVVEALKMESETLKDLDHPNIVQYLGFEQTPDFLSIFLEYVPGGSVAGCLRKHGKFEDQITRSFTGQILDGLEYLHSNGIIHRDLKADNILVDPSGICKISDFGISKRTADIEENGIHTSMKGSVFWMAPEVVQAARKGEQHGYNGKVDIWSLGCVVLEMWAGRRPWQDVDAIAVIFELITKQQAPPVPEDVVLTQDADDFRQKCFYIKPDERPSATELRKHPYLTLRPDWIFTGFK